MSSVAVSAPQYGSVSRYVDERLDSGEKNGEDVARINDGVVREIVQLWRD